MIKAANLPTELRRKSAKIQNRTPNIMMAGANGDLRTAMVHHV